MKLQYFGHFMQRVDSLEKTPMLGRIGGRRRRGQQKDEMAGWHHRLDGREFEWTPGVSDGQGVLACCNSWSHKKLDTTERLNWTELNWTVVACFCLASFIYYYYNVFTVLSIYGSYQHFIFYGWIIFYCVNILHFVC